MPGLGGWHREASDRLQRGQVVERDCASVRAHVQAKVSPRQPQMVRLKSLLALPQSVAIVCRIKVKP